MKSPTETPEETHDMINETPEEAQVPENIDTEEISINYVVTGKRWNRNDTIVDEYFAYNVAFDIMMDPEDLAPKSVDECRRRKDWPKWKEAIEKELSSLNKHNIFAPVVLTPEGTKHVSYKWVFVRKRNDKNEIIRYKARLVA